MANNTFKKITSYIIYGHEYVIFYNAEGWENDLNDNHYCAFKREWITDGRLNRTVNGLDMMISQSVDEVINHINNRETLNHIMETENIDIFEAMKIMIEAEHQEA